jgi:large subunit ribosomal protein L33
MASVRELVALECAECKRRNYTTSKNKKKAGDKLVLKKYCSHDRKHTEHRETKVKS